MFSIPQNCQRHQNQEKSETMSEPKEALGDTTTNCNKCIKG